jgi:hypothetical protein
MSAVGSKNIWFKLVGADRQPYKGASASSVLIPGQPRVDRFCDAVTTKLSENYLRGISPHDLKVYLLKDAFEVRHELPKTLCIQYLGLSKENPLLVLVPGPLWFQLIGPDGQPYKGASASSVLIPGQPRVDRFCDAVTAKLSENYLRGISPHDLKVYSEKDAFEVRHELPKTLCIQYLGLSKENPLLVLVPGPLWFQLIGPDGQPYKGASASSVLIPGQPRVDRFCDAVTAKFSENYLRGISPHDLKVYYKKAAFELPKTHVLEDLGMSKRNPLFVLVPSQ